MASRQRPQGTSHQAWMQGMHNGQNPAQAVPRNNLGVLRGHSVSIAGCGFARGRPLALPMRPGREAERLTEDPFGGVDGKRGADQGLDDFGDRAAATDRDLLDALIEIGIDLQLQALGEPHGIDRDGLPFRGGGGQEANTNELIHGSHSVRSSGIAQLSWVGDTPRSLRSPTRICVPRQGAAGS